MNQRHSFLPLVLVATLVAGCSTKPRSTKDADLIQHFLAHEADFEKLRLMLADDKDLGVIYSDGSCAGPAVPGSRSKVTLSPAREVAYLELIGRLDGRDISSEHNQGAHRVDIFVGGFQGKGVYILKGYVYSSKELAPLKSSSDFSNEEGLRGGERWYERIKGDWYLYGESAGSYD
jgi:hypothetical protein